MSTTFKDFATWIFYGLLSYVALNISGNMSKIQDGVTLLNQQVAVIISESHASRKDIDDHETRIRMIESKVK